VIRLTVLTVSVVPAGIVAAFKHEIAKHAEITAISTKNVFDIMSQ
jgi:hypothetical protein